MDYAQAYEWLIGTMRHGSRLGLERMHDLLEHLGHPEKKLRFVHLAGTNGKGSTTSFTASILAAADLKVGLFISPYLERFGERIRILDGRAGLNRWQEDPTTGEFRDEDLVRWAETLQQAIKELELPENQHPTHFELLTLMAFLHFAAEACDIVVLETGLGGTKDATNIIPGAIVHIITTISYDHEDVLGHEIRQIAENKAGIIKAPTPVILYDPRDGVLSPEEAQIVREVMEERCEQIGAPLEIVSSEAVSTESRSIDYQVFKHYPTGLELTTRLVADFQTENAALALAATRHILSNEVYFDAAILGVSLAQWPGRFELILRDPPVIIDGAHNPESTAALVRNLRALLPGRKLYTVVGLLEDKDYATMLRLYFEHPSLIKTHCLCLEARNPRALNPQALAEHIAAIDPLLEVKVGTWDELQEFLLQAHEDQAVVVAWGSFYLIGPLKTEVRRAYNRAQNNEVKHEIS